MERHPLLLPLCLGKPRGPVAIALADASGRRSTLRAAGAVRSSDAGFLRAAALERPGRPQLAAVR